MNELTVEETDRACAMVGITADQMGARAMSVAGAAAVILAQRDDPSIPDETWKTLKIVDLVMVDAVDVEDDADPT
ncbi:hypothetical protein [Streptomyces sp. NPDC050485]|uniref:hypothetical protein n=1 Tax=Streptomyces sp. NPDC050485 TaxID=3365617 RepID=UPI0037A58583